MWCYSVIFCILFAFVGVGFQFYIMLNDTMKNVSTILKRLEYFDRRAITSDKHFEDLDRAVTNVGMLIDSVDKELKEKSDSIDKELKEKSESIARLRDQIKAQPQASATYIRWGRSSCPENDSALVYHGIAAGSSQNNKVAAANHLCLPTEPTYGSYYEDEVQHGGHVYGTNYYFATRSDNMKFFPGISATPHLHTQTVPCALCHVKRGSMVMISAKNVCPAGWTVEYKGLLVSGMSHDKGVSNFICLDADPEAAKHIEFRVDAKRLYLVEGTCDSLPCPPFVHGRELTCAVCTK